MSARTRESVLPLQSSSSLILASISREGDSPLVVALLVFALFFIWLAPHSAAFRFSLSAPRPAPGLQGTSATRTWRPGRPAADPAGSPTAPCAGGSPCA